MTQPIDEPKPPRPIVVVTANADRCTRDEHPCEARARSRHRRARLTRDDPPVRFQIVSGMGTDRGWIVCHGCATDAEFAAIRYELGRATKLTKDNVPNLIAVVPTRRVKEEVAALADGVPDELYNEAPVVADQESPQSAVVRAREPVTVGLDALQRMVVEPVDQRGPEPDPATALVEGRTVMPKTTVLEPSVRPAFAASLLEPHTPATPNPRAPRIDLMRLVALLVILTAVGLLLWWLVRRSH